jgi:hypothetical protein
MTPFDEEVRFAASDVGTIGKRHHDCELNTLGPTQLSDELGVTFRQSRHDAA